MAATSSSPTSPAHTTSGADGAESTPQSSLTSPAPIPAKDEKRKSMSPPQESREGEEEVSALSEMMCSLVTNTYGETRFIGEWRLLT